MDKRGAGPGRPLTLRGRARERAALDDVVSAIQRGEGRSLVLRGEAGIGKTALLEYLVESASEITVLRAVGVESEMELAYASLHQLCLPLLERLPTLPAPQRQALEIVFGLSSGAAPDRFLVALAVLSLLSEVAGERPLLLVVDDAQWLDQASALTLAFVARRLLAEPVGILFGAREPGLELRNLPELEVTGLVNGDARALLGAAVRFRLDERVRDLIIAETRGNPLALLELPRGLTATQLAGGFGLLGAHALSGRIEQSFVRRLSRLSDDARRLLLLAAADPVGDPALLWSAARRLGIGAEASAEATDGLLSIDRRVTFRHPLVRSAVYGSAQAEQRRAVHLALAQATDKRTDPDRRAWHLAAAAAGPDEQVAVELESSAGRAQGRGGIAAAAAFLERSVALSADPGRRTERALAAADASLSAGAYESALALLAVAEAEPLDPLQRGRLQLLHAVAAHAQRRGSDAPPLLLRAAKTLEPLDPKLARETYLDAWSASLFAGQLATAGNLYDVSREARRAPPAPEPARPSDLLLDGLALLLTSGREPATPVMRRAVKGFAGDDASIEEVLRWGWLATVTAVVVWDYESCLAIAARAVQLARESGALTVLAVALNIMTQAVAMSGDFATASQLISEADAVAEATGSEIGSYGALYLGGFQGRDPPISNLIDATIREATPGGQGTAVQFATFAASVLANGRGRYRDALAPAQETGEYMPELVTAGWALCEIVEAATRCGEIDAAERALERLVERNEFISTDWGLGLEARCRALLAEPDAAETLYREAIDRLGRTRLRPELARAHLLYGEWLRVQNRRVDAREQLRTAYDQLTSIGMEAFAERARAELLATGVKVRRRTFETTDDLTAQERQIARLACDGLSNTEIGARLFLSPRTVEWHLRKVFAKLEIHSRGELADALRHAGAELPAARARA
jgi:DNA-binding CsgD family transcriptional regulator